LPLVVRLEGNNVCRRQKTMAESGLTLITGDSMAGRGAEGGEGRGKTDIFEELRAHVLAERNSRMKKVATTSSHVIGGELQKQMMNWPEQHEQSKRRCDCLCANRWCARWIPNQRPVRRGLRHRRQQSATNL